MLTNCVKNMFTYNEFGEIYKKKQRKHKTYSYNVNNNLQIIWTVSLIKARHDDFQLIKNIEEQLFSNHQRVAGRVDYLCGVDKKLFKTN